MFGKCHFPAVDVGSCHGIVICAAAAVHPVILSPQPHFVSDFKPGDAVRLGMPVRRAHLCPVRAAVWVRRVRICRSVQIFKQIRRIHRASLSHRINPYGFCAQVVINPSHRFVHTEIGLYRTKQVSVNRLFSVFHRPDCAFPVIQIGNRSARITYGAKRGLFYILVKFVFYFAFRRIPGTVSVIVIPVINTEHSVRNVPQFFIRMHLNGNDNGFFVSFDC